MKCRDAGVVTRCLVVAAIHQTTIRDTMTTLELGHKARVALQHGANSRPALLYRRIVRYVW